MKTKYRKLVADGRWSKRLFYSMYVMALGGKKGLWPGSRCGLASPSLLMCRSFSIHTAMTVILAILTNQAFFGPVSMVAEAGETHKQLREQYNLDKGNYKGSAKLTVEESSVILGKKVRLSLAFENSSSDVVTVLNPSLNSSPLTVAYVSIFELNGRYIGDLLAPNMASGRTRPVASSDWCKIDSGQTYKRRVNFTAGIVGGTRYRTRRHGLSPGRYLIQAVYCDYFATSCPWGEPANPCGTNNGLRDRNGEFYVPMESVDGDYRSKKLREWRKIYTGKELFRSNVLEITILPRPVEATRP